MSKYIDAESLQKEVKRLEKAAHKSALGCADSETRKFNEGKDFAYQHVGVLIDSLQQEQPEFPTTDEQMKEFLATHPKIEVPEKYKNPDWLFKKLGQPEVDLEKEIDACWQNWLSPSDYNEVEGVLPKTEFATYARHFAEWQKNQMMKVAAVEGEVYQYHSYNRDATAILVDIPKENLGDKVRVIIVKEEK